MPTLYADDSSSSQAWERALLVARPDTVVVRDAPPPKKVSKKKRKLLIKPPFLACRGIVTELTETAFPASYHKPAVTAALLPCARTLAAFDDRPTWEPALHGAPSQLKHVFQGDAYKEALAIVDPVARAAPVVARILEVLRDDLGFSITLAFAPRPEGGDLRTWARTSIYGEEVLIPQRVLGASGKMRLALRKPETWRLTTDTGTWTCRISRPARPTELFRTTSTRSWYRARLLENASRLLKMSTRGASSLMVGRCPR